MTSALNNLLTLLGRNASVSPAPKHAHTHFRNAWYLFPSRIRRDLTQKRDAIKISVKKKGYKNEALIMK